MGRRTERTLPSSKEAEKIKKDFIKEFNSKQKVKEKLKTSNFSEILGALGREIERLDIELEMHRKLIKIGELEVKSDEMQIKDLQRMLKDHRNALEEYRIGDQQLKQKKQSLCKKMSHFQKLEKQFNRTILLHNSATTKQIAANMNGRIVTTRRDANILKDKGIVIDETFNPMHAEHLIINIPEGIKNRYEPFDWKTISDFCEMVANYKMTVESGEETNIILLYSNSDIAEILKANGLTVY